MNGIKFGVENSSFGPPKGMTEEEVFTLPVLKTIDLEFNTPVIISCWQASEEEMAEFINNGGKLYVKVFPLQIP